MTDGKPGSVADGASGNRSLMRRIGLADDALPQGGGWYPNDRVLEAALDRIAGHDSPCIAILGGGLAVAVLACGLGDHGTVWMVEHDPQVIDITLGMLERSGGRAGVRIIEAELQDYDQHTLWYDRIAISELPDSLDLIFIDGPPHFCGRMPRYPAGPELFRKLSATGSVVLDKASRAKEKKTLTRWAGEFPHLAQQKLKGGAVLLSAR